MTDNPAIEAMARAIMIARPNGGCIVSDWQKEAVDNPHVSTALAQAQAAYDALAAAGFAVVPVEPTPRMRLAGSRADNDAQCSPFHIPPEQSSLMVYAAMIAAPTPPTT